jgi:hypothetical protein
VGTRDPNNVVVHPGTFPDHGRPKLQGDCHFRVGLPQ